MAPTSEDLSCSANERKRGATCDVRACLCCRCWLTVTRVAMLLTMSVAVLPELRVIGSSVRETCVRSASYIGLANVAAQQWPETARRHVSSDALTAAGQQPLGSTMQTSSCNVRWTEGSYSSAMGHVSARPCDACGLAALRATTSCTRGASNDFDLATDCPRLLNHDEGVRSRSVRSLHSPLSRSRYDANV